MGGVDVDIASRFDDDDELCDGPADDEITYMLSGRSESALGAGRARGIGPDPGTYPLGLP